MQTVADSPATLLRKTLPHRLRAAGIHISISAVIFAVALYLILVRWYPGFHFAVDGGWQGVRIMAAVDLVLGPFLTLIVFNPFKARRLIAFDLTCIGMAQLAALVWGFYAVYGQRPVSLNFYDGVVYSMPAHTVRDEPDARAALERVTDRHPGLVYVAMPATRDEWQRLKQRDHRSLPHEDAYFFQPFAPHWKDMQASAVGVAHHDPLAERDLPGFLDRHGGREQDYRFFRYQGGYGNCLIAFSAAGEPVDALGCDAG